MLNLGTQNAPALWLSCARAAMIHGIRLAPGSPRRVPDERRLSRAVAAWSTATVTTCANTANSAKYTV